MTNDEQISELQHQLDQTRRERDLAHGRCRTVTQLIIHTIGSSGGPEDLEEAVGRLASKWTTQRKNIQHYQEKLAEAAAARRHAQEVSSDLANEKRELEAKIEQMKQFMTLAIPRVDGIIRVARIGSGQWTVSANWGVMVASFLLKDRAESFASALRARQAMDELPSTPSETIASVTAWANETFGQATVKAQMERAKKEWAELIDLFHPPDHTECCIPKKVAEEAADVCICLYRVIGTLDPEAINKKMAINRARKWNVDGQGCAQHVGEE